MEKNSFCPRIQGNTPIWMKLGIGSDMGKWGMTSLLEEGQERGWGCGIVQTQRERRGRDRGREEREGGGWRWGVAEGRERESRGGGAHG